MADWPFPGAVMMTEALEVDLPYGGGGEFHNKPAHAVPLASARQHP